EIVLRRRGTGMLVGSVAATLALFSPAGAQQPPAKSDQEPAAQLELRRTAKSREYQGKPVEGEDRVIRPRDTLWRILIQERGLSEKRFKRYVLLVGALNPNLKNPDVLQVGDTLFIPVQADEILGLKAAIEAAEKTAATKVVAETAPKDSYQVKPGDTLYKVLREQLGLDGVETLRRAAEQVKELNPGKKNWDILLVGETIRLPGGTAMASVVQPVAPKAKADEAAPVVGVDYGKKITVQENLDLLASVMKVLGQETNRAGEEVVSLREGTVHIDRSSYPIVHGPKKGQRVVLDMQSKITATLQSKLAAAGPGLPVVSVKKGASLHDAVTGLLSKLGFQSLPSNQPVVIQDGGVALQVKGEWMVMPPDESGAMPQVLVVSLTDAPGQTPDYLRDYLSLKGMNLKEILLPSPASMTTAPASSGAKPAEPRIETWPTDKTALVDTFLKDYGITFSSGGQFPVLLRDGIRLDAKVDRLFEYGGKKVALSFKPFGDELMTALQQSEAVRVVELDLAAASSRELIARLLAAVGESATYREQRFQANDRAAKDKLTLGVSGYYLPQRSLLLTDRQIPKELERFFGEKGLRVVRFQ
ncbi:MAG: LysM peptidoglycan-binding domain-containing protein, partial [Candidatus Binatia bacterium]